MPLHTTRDPGKRAAHIAMREADKAYARTDDLGAFADTYEGTYEQAAVELQPLDIPRRRKSIR